MRSGKAHLGGLGEVGVCVVYVFARASIQQVHLPGVSCKVHIMIRLFPDTLIELEDSPVLEVRAEKGG